MEQLHSVSTRRSLRLRIPLAVGAVVFLLSAIAWAHERFIKHALKVPLDRHFFLNSHYFKGVPEHGFLGVNNNIWVITANSCIVLSLFLLVWFWRQPLQEFMMTRVFRGLKGKPQRFMHHLICFLTDRPVRSPIFNTIGQWALIMFMRSPALVLMYSATNDSLVMPSYPLEPKAAVYFKFIQVALAILILTQTLLPVCGAVILGTWLYLNRWGFMVGVDAVPVLTAAIVYITSPMRSHDLTITRLNRYQMRYLRLVLGVGFFALGWLKCYNHNLVAGVVDNYPASADDPMLSALAKLPLPASWVQFAQYKRESFIMAFGLSEVLCGFMVMMGIFSRVWTSMMAWTFANLMLFVYGFDEIPHIYPIGGCLAVIFSNQLTSELDPIEEIEERLGRQGRLGAQILLVLAVGIGVSFLILFPPQYFISLFDRSNL